MVREQWNDMRKSVFIIYIKHSLMLLDRTNVNCVILQAAEVHIHTTLYQYYIYRDTDAQCAI